MKKPMITTRLQRDWVHKFNGIILCQQGVSKRMLHYLNVVFFMLACLQLVNAQNFEGVPYEMAMSPYQSSGIMSTMVTYTDRWGYPITTAAATAGTNTNNITTCGKFQLVFADEILQNGTGFDAPNGLGQTRKNTACAVFTYLESVIDIGNVHPIIYFDESQNNSATSLVKASPFFDANLASGTLTGGTLHDLLTTNTNNLPNNMASAYLQLNFAAQNGINIHSDHTTAANGELDLFSIILHGATQCLGFHSLIQSSGVSFLNGSANGPFSLYDQYLSANNTPLITNGAFSVSAAVLGNGNVIYQKTGNTLDYTVANNLNLGCLNGEEDLKPYAMNVYVNNARQYSLGEKEILCNLGYARANASCLDRYPVANEDDFTINTNGQTCVDVLQNDSDLDGDSLEIVASSLFYDTTVISITVVNNQICITPVTTFDDVTAFVYQVKDLNHNVVSEPTIVYISMEVSANCNYDPLFGGCNLMCNGSFEHGISKWVYCNIWKAYSTPFEGLRRNPFKFCHSANIAAKRWCRTTGTPNLFIKNSCNDFDIPNNYMSFGGVDLPVMLPDENRYVMVAFQKGGFEGIYHHLLEPLEACKAYKLKFWGFPISQITIPDSFPNMRITLAETEPPYQAGIGGWLNHINTPGVQFSNIRLVGDVWGNYTVNLAPIPTSNIKYIAIEPEGTPTDSFAQQINIFLDRFSLEVAPDLTISKTVNNPKPHYGDTISYTIKVKNNTNCPKTNIVVLDSFPSGFIWDNNGTYATGTGQPIQIAVIPILTAQEEYTLVMSVIVLNRPCDTVKNWAYIDSYDGYDLSSCTFGYPKSSVDVIVRTPDIKVSQTMIPPLPLPDSLVKIFIHVSNIGSGETLDSLQIQEMLPPCFQFDGYSASNDGFIYNDSLGIITIPPLEADSSGYIEIHAIYLNKSDSCNNCIKFLAPEGFSQCDTTNDVSCYQKKLDLKINKTMVDAFPTSLNDSVIYPIYIGDTVTYEIKIIPSDTVAMVHVTDFIPDCLKFVRIDTNNLHIHYIHYPDDLIIEDTILANLSARFYVTCVYMSGGDSLGCVNKATVNSPWYHEINLANNIDTVKILPRKVNLVITKTANTPILAGVPNGISYTINVTNYGPYPIREFVLMDLVPNCLASLDSIKLIPNQILPDSFHIYQAQNSGIAAIQYPQGTGLSGDSGTISFSVTATYPNGAELCVNNACVWATTDYLETNEKNNCDNDSVVVKADIEVNKTLLGDVTSIPAGSGVLFLLKIKNNGPQIAMDIHLADYWKNGCFKYQNFSAHNPHNGPAQNAPPFTYNASVNSPNSYSAEIVIDRLNPNQEVWILMNMTYLIDHCTNCKNAVEFTHFNGIETNANNNHAEVTMEAEPLSDEIFIDAPNNFIQPAQIPNIQNMGNGEWLLNGTITNIQNVLVSDNTTIEIPSGETLHIDFADLTMGSAAKIIVRNGGTLNFVTNVHIHGCLDMWDRIELESGAILRNKGATLIEDADYAIYLHDNVLNINLHDIIFRNNAIGIYMPPNPSGVLNTLPNYTINNNFFEGTGSMLQAFPGQINPSLGFPYAGIDIADMIFKLSNNHFDGLTNGIIGRHSNLYISKCDFNYMTPMPYPNSPFNGSGIAILGQHCKPSFPPKDHCMGSLWLTGTNINPNIGPTDFTMSNTWFGVWADQANIEVNNTKMYDTRTGIYTQNATNKVGRIYDNELHTWRTGINLFMTGQAVDMHIHENEIFLNANTPFSHGIKVNDFNIGNPNLNIEQNNIEITNGGCGISTLSSSQSRITANTVNMNANNAYIASGIAITGGDAMQVECNDVTGMNANGYTMMVAFNSTIGCNRSFSNDTGFSFFGPNPGTIIRGNEMHNDGLGLSLSLGADIDEQFNTGNMWTGTTSTWAARRYGWDPNDNGLTGRFWISPFNPAGNSLNPSVTKIFPYLTGANNWIREDVSTPPNPLFDCLNSGNICGWDNNMYRSISSKDTLIAQDSLQPVIYPVELRKTAGEYLYEKIQRDTTLIDSSQVIADFYSQQAQTNLGERMEIRKQMRSFYNPSIRTLLEEYHSNIKGYFHLLAINDSIKATHPSPQDSLQLLASDSLLYSQIQQTEGLIKNLLALEEGNVATKVGNLIVENGTIMTAMTMEENEKVVNDIYLKTISQGISAFDAMQQAQLENIIWQCPLAGGVAVFKARSLYSLINDSLQYNDYEACNQVGLAWRTQQSTPKTELSSSFSSYILSVHPNPAKDKVIFDFEQTNKIEGILSIYSSLGSLITQQPISSNQSTLSLNISNWDEGIYYYLFNDSINKVETGKFVIIR